MNRTVESGIDVLTKPEDMGSVTIVLFQDPVQRM